MSQMIELIHRAKTFSDRKAIISNGQTYTYQQLLDVSTAYAQQLLGAEKDLAEARVAFMIPPSFAYVAMQWAIWRAGGIAVPLCTLHPLPSLQYVIEDTDAQTLIVSKEYWDLLKPLAEERKMRLLLVEELETRVEDCLLPDVDTERRAMILYTSGTTNLPKGVVSTHKNIEFQIKTLVNAWEWDSDDHILNILPLHHVHGIINVLSCALWSGACCEFLPKFDAEKVWEKLSSGQLTLFMAVPTIYFKLIAFWEAAIATEQERMSKAVNQLRLMVSGSAALPVSVLEKWKAISGHTLLERYGMTEIGMALSNSYRGERRAGHVGLPLPDVEIRLVNSEGKAVGTGEAGEIQVKGPSVFKEYWQKPEATEAAFVDSWFRSGDIAVFNEGSYKILGRDSVDIIKSGGYKISALEIEDVLRQHPLIKDCAVVGLPDEEWGEIVAASLVLNDKGLIFNDLKNWLKDLLPAYKVPRKFMIQEELPRNTLGKVTKKAVKAAFSQLEHQPIFDFKKGEILLVNKPLGWTSFDVVNKIRYALRRKLGVKKIKVGHAGTLDPQATGLLIICTGKFTKKLAEFQGLGKAYTGTIVLGATRPSYDSETEIDQTYPTAHIDKLLMDKTREQFIGDIAQLPPMYSAVKVKGERLYQKARKGEKVEVKARSVSIYEFEFTRVEMPEVDFQVFCSKGTYIRSLAHDFGKLLGSGGYLARLCRTQIGPYLLKDAWQLTDLISCIENCQVVDRA